MAGLVGRHGLDSRAPGRTHSLSAGGSRADGGSLSTKAAAPHCRGRCGPPIRRAPSIPSFVPAHRLPQPPGKAKGGALPGAPAPSRGGPGRWGGTGNAQERSVGIHGSLRGLEQVAAPALASVSLISTAVIITPTPMGSLRV